MGISRQRAEHEPGMCAGSKEVPTVSGAVLTGARPVDQGNYYFPLLRTH